MRIDTAAGVIEVGGINYSPRLQRRPAATEAMYLLMRRVFDELKYRRYEWKCDALNAPSRAAAIRLGFRYEGLFRQATVYKGRNRDTAWFSIIDSEWPALAPGLRVLARSGQFRWRRPAAPNPAKLSLPWVARSDQAPTCESVLREAPRNRTISRCRLDQRDSPAAQMVAHALPNGLRPAEDPVREKRRGARRRPTQKPEIQYRDRAGSRDAADRRDRRGKARHPRLMRSSPTANTRPRSRSTTSARCPTGRTPS